MNDKFLDHTWFEEGGVPSTQSLLPGAMVASWLASTDSLLTRWDRTASKPSDAYARFDGRLLLEDIETSRRKVVRQVVKSDDFWSRLRDAGGGNEFATPDTWAFADEMAQWLTQTFGAPKARSAAPFERLLRQCKKDGLFPEQITRWLGRVTVEQAARLQAITALEQDQGLPPAYAHALAQMLGEYARGAERALVEIAIAPEESFVRRSAAIHCLEELNAADALAEVFVLLEERGDDDPSFERSILYAATSSLCMVLYTHSLATDASGVRRAAARLLAKTDWPWPSKPMIMLVRIGDADSLALLEREAENLQRRAPGDKRVAGGIKALRKRLAGGDGPVWPAT